MKKIVIIGTGKLPCLCAEYCKDKYGIEIYEYGSYSMSTLKQWSTKHEVSYHSVMKEELTDILLELNEETLVVSANNTYLFPTSILSKKEITAINFHPSLLPKHPGRNAEAWAIYEEEEYSGITWHVIDTNIDGGSIICQEKIDLNEKTTSLKLMILQFDIAAKCFCSFADRIIESGIDSLELTYNTTKSSDIHLSTDIPNDGVLDISWATIKMSSFLRAMDYGPLNVLGKPYCYIDEEKYVWDSYEISENSDGTESAPVEGLFSDDIYTIRLKGWRKV